MVTKNADTASNVNLWIVDDQLKKIAQTQGVEMMESPKAWEQLPWTRQYFQEEPQQGYFIWIKEQPGCALFSCVNIQEESFQQKMSNLTIIESGLKAEFTGVCSALALKLHAMHTAQGTVVLKPGAQVKYNHVHRWGKEDVVSPDYLFILEKGSRIDYTYKTKNPPQELHLKNRFKVYDRAKVKLNIIGDLQDTHLTSLDEIELLGDKSSGISNLRFISRAQTEIEARSRMVATSTGTGHLDCQSLNLDPSAQVTLIPEVVVKHDQAQITHEASIGRVSDKQLNYLQMRGLSEAEAIDLIASGFLKI